MDFHFYLGNHTFPYQDTLTDGMYCLAAGLAEQGHRFTTSHHHLEPGKINILWELFSPQQSRELAESGLTYGIVTTEVPDGGGFNNRRDGDWGARWEGFVLTASKASFIWSLVEEAVPAYQHMAPTTFVELGYSPLLLPPKLDLPQTHDFCFFGYPTPYRVEILKRLEKHASVLWHSGFVASGDLPKMIAHTKVGIALKLEKDWPIPSATRLSRLMHAGTGVACEGTRRTTRQSRLVPQQPEGMDFVDFALQRLAADPKAEGAETLARYRAELPMKAVMEAVLDATLPAAARAGR